jgi:preprotein translocase subunit SecE
VEEILPTLQRAQAAQGNEVMAVEVANRRGGEVGPPGPTDGNRFTRFFRRIAELNHEIQDEMRKVTWPDRAQLKDTTIKIIIFVLFIGAVIGVIDLVLQLIFVQGIPSLFSRR